MRYGANSACNRIFCSTGEETTMSEEQDHNRPAAQSVALTGRNTVQLVYVLQAVGFLIGITWIAGVIVNYVKQDEVKGSWLESHFRWQMRTFWFGLLWGVLGGITTLVGIGFLIIAVNYIWLIYRVVKGWLDLSSNKPMYAKQAA
jgi:uncharacterized membrane protein